MLVGNAGCGKSLLVSDTLKKLSGDYMVANVPFNYYTTPAMLQSKWDLYKSIYTNNLFKYLI